MEQLPAILALPGHQLDHCALSWLGANGYRYETGPGTSGRLVFVRDGINPWQPMPAAMAEALLRQQAQAPAKEGS